MDEYIHVAILRPTSKYCYVALDRQLHHIDHFDTVLQYSAFINPLHIGLW